MDREFSGYVGEGPSAFNWVVTVTNAVEEALAVPGCTMLLLVSTTRPVLVTSDVMGEKGGQNPSPAFSGTVSA